MPLATPLPLDLQRIPFSTRTAIDRGVREGRLRASDVQHPFHGVQRVVQVPDDIRSRCLDYLPRMREGQFFSHLTAAELWGLPIPRLVRPGGELDVAAVRPTRAPRTRGVIGHDLTADGVRVQMLGPLPVADVLSTWVQLRSLVGPRFDFADLVAAGDAAVLRRPRADRTLAPALTTLDELRARVRTADRRGRVLLAQAAEAVREGAESAPETRLRLVLLDGGLPEPLVNADVYDEFGLFLGRGDLVYPDSCLVVEYDGDDHRTSVARYERDQTRIDAFREARWHVIRIRAQALYKRPAWVVQRVRRALR
ncbi:hypothetical protein NY547_00895 [Cnuibacter physcomitrellae]|uniref:hypothetical protein n=1 Tax=Cnuibacter physcomitrellae TaxID=1619308 RepID=UPI002175E85F|nr:hypothetical protein [Cnuibacter physcomitrellae]MCS5495795.1 hypothetical protein [Cnuibacter physcomitrellae]